ncbi:hypothetical protein B0H13DRAFT_2672851 [Mycena leptocephala]|nr:hypothetical protein B0H13DRAFT_2672851 [Mycena leptocephala]
MANYMAAAVSDMYIILVNLNAAFESILTCCIFWLGALLFLVLAQGALAVRCGTDYPPCPPDEICCATETPGVNTLGADWFFENRVADPGADDWVAWVHGAGSQSLLTVPALDWVSKDATSYSYPVSEYPGQASADPFLATVGSGRFPNGSAVGPLPDPTTVYTPWNTTMANKPTLVAIDNEIEIASIASCEVARVLNFSLVAKEAILGVKVAAPSTCAWWFCAFTLSFLVKFHFILTTMYLILGTGARS